jgi:hypothetical protein
MYQRRAPAVAPLPREKVMDESESEKLPTEAQLALQSGHKLDAVKIVREQTGLGLGAARELVERADRANRAEKLDVPRQAQGREESGVLRLIVILAVLGVLAFAVFWLLPRM